METINGLLRALDNKVPASMAKRIDGLQKLNVKLETARSEHDANPTEASQDALDEIIEFIKDTQEDVQEDLETLVEQKRSANLKAQGEEKKRREQEALAKRGEQEALAKRRKQQEELANRRASEKAQKDAEELREKEDLEKKESEEQELKTDDETKTEKKSGIGWGSLLLGGILLVATGGAIKYFGNKK
jgi:hypothetical protein